MTFTLFFILLSLSPSVAQAYPIFAQKAYEMPREETRRIVCANCHLAAKPVSIEAPQSILPSQVFSVTAKVPVDPNAQQILGSRQKGPLNVRALIITPPNVRLAQKSELTDEQRKLSKGVVFQQFNKENPNIFVARPLPANKSLTINLVAPKEMSYGTYPIFVRGNRGRGQIYPDGQKSNNTTYTSPIAGVVQSITEDAKGALVRVVSGDQTAEIEIPTRPKIIVEKRIQLQADQPLTKNPNVRGFGQAQTEIVFQNPIRLLSLQLFLWGVLIAQCSLVLKKKQIEQTSFRA